jgi:beta-phosphoglucomutase-like phosphatase (HAD superfamily)
VGGTPRVSLVCCDLASTVIDGSVLERAAADRFAVAPPPGFADALGQLAEAGLKVCLLTTLSRDAIGPLLDELRRQGMADLTLCGDDAPRGFPWPDLVLTALLRLGAFHALVAPAA